MAVLNGTSLTIQTDIVANDTPVDVTLQSEVSISFEMEEIDTTSKSDLGYKTVIPGKRSASCSFSGFLDDGDGANNWFSLLGLWASDSGQTTITITDDTNVTFSGEAILTSMEVSAGVEDSTQVSGSFVFNGAVSIA
jgi:predicted secreted protein